MAYTAIAEPPSDPLLTGTEIALTAAGGVVALVLAGFIGLLVYRHCRESWAARHAPTDQNAPFCYGVHRHPGLDGLVGSLP